MKNILKKWKPILFVLSFFLQDYFIDVGMSLKIFFLIIPFLLIISKPKDLGKVRFELFEILFLLFYSFEIFSIVYSVHVLSSLRLIKGIVFVGIMYFLAKILIFRFEKKEIKSAFKFVGILFPLISLSLFSFSLLQNIDLIGNGQLIDFPGLTFDKGVPRLIGTFSDPNIISFYSLFFLVFYIQFFKDSLIDKIGFFLILLLCILTVSRSFVLAISVIILFNIIKDLNIILKKEYLIVFIIGFFVFVGMYQFEVVKTIIESRTNNISSASGRLELWRNMWYLFKQSPIYGNGIFTSRWLNTTLFNNDHLPHNTYLGILIETGFIGFTLFIASLSALFFYLNKKVKLNPDLKYLMNFYIGAIVFIFTLSAIISEIFILFNIVLLRLSYNNNSSSKV